MKLYYCISYYADVPDDEYNDLNEAILAETKYIRNELLEFYEECDPQILTIEIQEA